MMMLILFHLMGVMPGMSVTWKTGSVVTLPLFVSKTVALTVKITVPVVKPMTVSPII